MDSPNLHLLPLLLLSLLLLSFPHPSSSSKCNKNDRKALLAIKSFWDNPSSLSDWGARPGCCDWSNIVCRAGRVSFLFIHLDSNLSGTIPDAVGDLPFLETLHLSELPNLVGSITLAITRLTKLKTLQLFKNCLSGSIPLFLTTMPNVEYLDLSSNKFTGTIPPELSSLKKLQVLELSDNDLTGSIPDSFGKFQAGICLYLAGNNLTGPVPRSIGALDFGLVDVSRNGLSGDASFLFRNPNATVIFIAGNMFEFDLSTVVFPGGMTRLDISRNRIYGRIPQQMAELTSLNELNVSYNRLCGEIPRGGSLGQFGPSSYVHNKCLCGTPLPSCM